MTQMEKPGKIERTWTWSQGLLAVPFVSTTSYSAPGQVTLPFEPQFPHLYNGDNYMSTAC